MMNTIMVAGGFDAQAAWSDAGRSTLHSPVQVVRSEGTVLPLIACQAPILASEHYTGQRVRSRPC
jgi:hypothetical protein